MFQKKDYANKKFIFLLLLFLLLFFFILKPTSREKFLFFYVENCPVAGKMFDFFPFIEKKFNVEIEKLEIAHNLTNMKLMKEFSNVLEKYCGSVVTPALLSLKTNATICGEKSLKEVEYFIENNL